MGSREEQEEESALLTFGIQHLNEIGKETSSHSFLCKSSFGGCVTSFCDIFKPALRSKDHLA